MPNTRKPYPPEFREQMVALVWAGRTPEDLAHEFEPTAQSISNWVAQADRDTGRRTDGLTTTERAELTQLGVVARIVTGPHEAHRQDPHRPMRYDTGRPRAVIRFRISQPRTASLPCPAGLRARRLSPMMDL